MKKNWILVLGLIAIVLYFLFLIVFGVQNNSRTFDIYGIPYNYFILISLLMPFFEEVIFRGIFTNTIKWEYFYWSVFIFISTIWIFFSYNIICSLGFLCVALVYLFLEWKKYISIKNFLLVFLSSITFALIHYSINDLKFLYTAYPILLHFGLGLFLTWIAINFGLKKAMIVHVSYNFIICVYISIPLFIVESKTNTVTIGNTSMSWKAQPRKLQNTVSIINNPNMIIVKCGSILDIDKFLLDKEIKKNIN
jgi:membrane protease YdiL (CAAX protease family)